MEATTCPPRDDRHPNGPARRGVACPYCEGVLIPLRGAFRCVRCCFSICPGCEDADPRGLAGTSY
jgi:hypothetical protein